MKMLPDEIDKVLDKLISSMEYDMFCLRHFKIKKVYEGRELKAFSIVNELEDDRIVRAVALDGPGSFDPKDSEECFRMILQTMDDSCEKIRWSMINARRAISSLIRNGAINEQE